MNEKKKCQMEDALFLAVAAYIEAKERPESQRSIDIRYIALKDTFADVNAYRKKLLGRTTKTWSRAIRIVREPGDTIVNSCTEALWQRLCCQRAFSVCT